MKHAPITITREDYAKLRLLVTTALHSNPSPALQKLREELDRAAVIDSAAIPPGVITMGSTVAFEDLGTGEVEEYTLTFPNHADVEKKRLSILAPIGTALIGFRVGDLVSWTTPGGIRKLKIRRVSTPDPQPASRAFVPVAALADVRDHSRSIAAP